MPHGNYDKNKNTRKTYCNILLTSQILWSKTMNHFKQHTEEKYYRINNKLIHDQRTT